MDSSVRPLSSTEIDQVSGGIIPIIIGAAVGVLAAAAVDAVSDALDASEGEDEEAPQEG